MNEVERLQSKVDELQRELAALRGDSGALWAKREWLWNKVEKLTGQGTWIWDLAQQRVEWSAHLYEILGVDECVSGTEAAGDFDRRVHPDDFPEFARGRARALDGLSNEPARFRFLRDDGVWVHLALVASPVADSRGTVTAFVGAILDMTYYEETKRRLVHHGRLESMGQLAGSVAHDFNNLLTVVAGNAEILRLGSAASNSPSEAEAALEQIIQSAAQGAELTRQLMTFTGRAQGLPESLDVDEVTHECEGLFTRIAPAEIRVRALATSDGARICVERGQLQSALLNLAINACDAMPEGGTLTLQARPARAGDFESHTDPTQPQLGDFIAFDVEDTGIGMTDAIASQVFEPFFTTKSELRGTGLGLPSIRAFAEKAGGWVAVTTRPGEGCRFTLILPRARGSQPQQELQLHNRVDEGTRARILLVEDDPGVRDLVLRMLAATGHETYAAASADEALVRWPELCSKVDLLLSDLAMPGMNGRQLATHLRNEQPELRVVFMTGFDPEAKECDASELVLHKPFTCEALLESITRSLDNPAR